MIITQSKLTTNEVVLSVSHDHCDYKLSILSELTAPTVTSTNEGLTNHGSVVVMTCTATGNAHPTMSWMDAERNTLVEGGVLRLSNVDVHSSGTYVCQAKRENTVKYSRPIHLNVTCKLTFYKNQTLKIAEIIPTCYPAN